jgi:hypothetical protein
MSPTPDDLLAAAQMCSERLLELRDRDWETQVVGLDWSCRQTLEHVASLAYGPVLATRARGFRPLAWIVRDGAPVEELVWTAHTLATVLAEVARAAPSGARAFHPAGMADASGFVAMGIDELLVHTHDIVTALGGTFRPPDRLTAAVLDRLFPWWPRHEPLWEALLWANGRAPLEGEADLGSSWLWHCAPIDEWDGRVPVWDPISHEPPRSD